jgi:hypothetical protein
VQQDAAPGAATFTGSAFNYVELKTHPLIEARPGQYVIPALPFLFTKVVDDPYYILSDHLTGQAQRRFQQALGSAFEAYAHALVRRALLRGGAGEWQVVSSPRNKNGDELADTYAQRGDGAAIAFEHKGQRPSAAFLAGGEGEKVLGPTAAILSQLQSGASVPIQGGRRHDDGLITRGLWQQSTHVEELAEWAEVKLGSRPSRMLHVIDHLADLRVDRVVRGVYLDVLMTAASLYTAEGSLRPQWLQVEDLERVACYGSESGLDLAGALENKCSEDPSQRFDQFLHDRLLGTKPARPSVLDKVALYLMRRAARTFSPSRARRTEASG